MQNNGVQITYSAQNANDLEVMVNIQGDTFEDVMKEIASPSAQLFLKGLKPKPIRTFGGGGFGGRGGAPTTVDLPDAPKNAEGKSFQPIKKKDGSSYFWSISTKDPSAPNGFKNEYAPQGTPQPTAEQYEKYLDLNPHKRK